MAQVNLEQLYRLEQALLHANILPDLLPMMSLIQWLENANQCLIVTYVPWTIPCIIPLFRKKHEQCL